MKNFFTLIFAVFIVFMFMEVPAGAKTYINDEVVVSIDNTDVLFSIDNQIRSIERSTIKTTDNTYVNYGTLGNVLYNTDAIDNEKLKSLIKGHTRINRLGYSTNDNLFKNVKYTRSITETTYFYRNKLDKLLFYKNYKSIEYIDIDNLQSYYSINKESKSMHFGK